MPKRKADDPPSFLTFSSSSYSPSPKKPPGKDRDQVRYGMIRRRDSDFSDGERKLWVSRRAAQDAPDRPMWTPETVLSSLDIKGLNKSGKKDLTDGFPVYGEKPTFEGTRLTNMPPAYVALTDEWVEIVCGLTTNRERGQKWPLDFNTQGDISADRIPVDPAPLKMAHGLFSFPVYRSYYILCGRTVARVLGYLFHDKSDGYVGAKTAPPTYFVYGAVWPSRILIREHEQLRLPPRQLHTWNPDHSSYDPWLAAIASDKMRASVADGKEHTGMEGIFVYPSGSCFAPAHLLKTPFSKLYRMSMKYPDSYFNTTETWVLTPDELSAKASAPISPDDDDDPQEATLSGEGTPCPAPRTSTPHAPAPQAPQLPGFGVDLQPPDTLLPLLKDIDELRSDPEATDKAAAEKTATLREFLPQYDRFEEALAEAAEYQAELLMATLQLRRPEIKQILQLPERLSKLESIAAIQTATLKELADEESNMTLRRKEAFRLAQLLKRAANARNQIKTLLPTEEEKLAAEEARRREIAFEQATKENDRRARERLAAQERLAQALAAEAKDQEGKGLTLTGTTSEMFDAMSTLLPDATPVPEIAKPNTDSTPETAISTTTPAPKTVPETAASAPPTGIPTVVASSLTTDGAGDADDLQDLTPEEFENYCRELHLL
ncbi:hypothetical protein N7462_008254 [Penicillium macrosclerotiorum]|uniref:uncharacterized protein n=1 Tax=Penicillium macrosclerotiorum TaxID=303699 RepID=UPI0025473EF3|nr:uncharacterized protein N7462_008254 [Penicillium macrosclerotiorum]KAJ5675357.1 hypothetical protein N7462_008254 [Penicillium macrosclerotiorum]